MLCAVGKLARRRIEQHAYIPYNAWLRRICDDLLTKRKLHLSWSAITLMRPAFGLFAQPRAREARAAQN
jgi:hypothetical protein